MDQEAQGDRDTRRIAKAERQRSPIATCDAVSRAHRDDTDIWSKCFQSAEKILPTQEVMSPSLLERVGCVGRHDERDLHHCTSTRRDPVVSNTRGEVLRRALRPL